MKTKAGNLKEVRATIVATMGMSSHRHVIRQQSQRHILKTTSQKCSVKVVSRNVLKFYTLRIPYRCSIFTYNSRVVILCPFTYITVSVKETEIQIEENTAEKDEREIIFQPSSDFSGRQFSEKGIPFNFLIALSQSTSNKNAMTRMLTMTMKTTTSNPRRSTPALHKIINCQGWSS